MILSKKYKYIFLQNPAVNLISFYKILNKFNDLNFVPTSYEDISLHERHDNKFTNKYWGTQSFSSDYLTFNLKTAIDVSLGAISTINLDEYKCYCVIGDPITRFLHTCIHLKKTGKWMYTLFNKELSDTATPQEIELAKEITLCPESVLPMLSPSFQIKYHSITFNDIAEKFLDFPFMWKYLDAFRTPQCYYDDPRVTFIAYDRFREKMIEMHDEHSIDDFRYIPYRLPNNYYDSDMSQFSSEVIEKIKLVYAEDMEMYERALNS